jgi:tetratricopeptide (TPR) repeat protein
MKVYALLHTVAIVFLFSCASGPVARTRSQALYGMIYDGDNRPVNNVAIYVDNTYRSSSDINGHFIITGLKPRVNFRVSAQKQGFEPVEIAVSYTDPSHVLYLRVLSGEELLGEAEAALREKRWYEAESLLDRAENTGVDAAPARYLRAILAFSREQYAEALAILGSIAETVRDAPYLYLFMADLCQYHLEAPEQARVYLGRVLELRHDEAAAKRLEDLNNYLDR